MFHRAGLTEQDVRTFRGIINSLLRWPRGPRDAQLKPRVGAISRGLADPEAGSPEDLEKTLENGENRV